MEFVFGQSGQSCGSMVSLCDGYKVLAQVGIGESTPVHLPDVKVCSLMVVCGTLAVVVDAHEGGNIAVSWNLSRRCMVVHLDNQLIGEAVVA